MKAAADSPAFTLDTRFSGDNPLFAALGIRLESESFTLDTRLPQDNPVLRSLVVQTESGPFTLDTLSGWLRTPAQTLAGGSAAGRARFLPDGLRLAKADGSRVLLWNLHSFRSNFVFTGHAGEVTTVDFSPLGDQLLTGSADGTLRWWDTASRREVGRTHPPGAGAVFAAYASDGARVLAGRGTNVSLYRVPTMQWMQELTGSEGSISAVAECPEGLALAGNSSRAALLWNTATGTLLRRLTNHTRLITAAAFFPSGSNAMTASLDGTIRVWDAVTGAERVLIKQGAPVGDAVVSANGRLIASCDTDNSSGAYLWDAQTGDLLRLFTDTGSETSPMVGVAISPDQTALATTHVDGRVRLWNTGLSPHPIQPVTPLPIGTNAPVTLRSHGLYYFEVDAEAGRSLVLTLEADPGGGSKSAKSTGSAGIPAGFGRGLSPDAKFANIGTSGTGKDAGAPRTKSLQTPPPGADITAFRMTATKGRLPSVYDYESFAQASVTNLHCELPLATSTSDKFYVLVFAPYLSAGTINARLRAEFADFHLSSVTPARGGNGGTVTSELLGTGLTPDTTARLFNAGGASVAGQLSLWGDSTKAWFSFDLNGSPAGNYSAEISRAGYVPAILTNAFTVLAGGTPLLQARLSAPAVVRPGRDYNLTLEYANVGDVDIAAPLFIVSTPTEKNWLYPLTPPGQPLALVPSQKRSGIQTMGANPSGPAHLLPPGARKEIPIYFQGDGSVSWNMPFTLSILRIDPTPIDWAALESQLRPTDMAADLWTAVWANFKALAGNTWADYHRILNIQAYIRGTSGQPTTDVAELLASLFSEAVGAPYRRTLFANVDASAPAPALPLQFARFTTDGLEHRFSLGPLGRGWSHNYEYTLSQPASDKIVIRTPGAGGRRFDRGSDNVWRGQAGDYGTLAVGAGWFVLTEKDGLSRQFDGSGLLVSIEEPNHNRVTLGYIGSQLASLTHSAGASFTLQYNGQGRLARLADHAGQVTDYEYDPAGEHLLRVVSPGAVTNSYTYQPVTGSPSDHALTSITFPDGTHQFFSWNSMGRLAEQSRDGGAERLRFTYSSGGVVSVRDDRNAVTTLRLGERGQLLQMTDALGHSVTFNYDTSYNLTRLTGPAGDTTEQAYDAQGHATRVSNPLAQTVNLTHTTFSRLDTLRDARNQLTDFGYDSRGNLTSITYPDTSAEQFGYDTAGSVTTWQNRRGQTVQFTRSAQGQLIRKTYPDGRTIDYHHDARGLLTNVTDTAGAPTFLSAITTLAYDTRGFLTAITYPDGKGFTFEYNAAGRRTRRVGHDAYTLNYGYDSVGRLETLTDGAARELVHYTYDSTGRLSRETKGNGTFTTYTYDLAGQLTALTNYASGAPTFLSALDDHTSHGDKNVHAPQADKNVGAPILSFFHYTYDAKGNRLTMTTAAGVTRYDYDPLNQLTGVTYPGGRHVTYAYDADGNRTNRHSTLNPQLSTSYFYDTENRLVRVSTPTNGVFQYTYDALGNRTAVVHDGVTNRFLHDPVGLVDVAAEYDATGALVSRYDHGIGLVSRTDGAGNSAFYSFDALGNTRELTGDAGSLLHSYDYDAFGAATVANEAVANSYRFVGRYGVTAEAADLTLMRARYYDRNLGRFMSIDPIRLFDGQGNLQSYCLNNPVRFVDPTGLKTRTGFDWGEFFSNLAESLWDLPGELVLTVPGQVAGQLYGLLTIPLHALTTLASIDEKMQQSGEPPGSALRYFFKGIDYLKDPMKPYEKALEELNGPTDPVGPGVDVPVVRPISPEEKFGPPGVGPAHVVPVEHELEYLIKFWNSPTAQVPVQDLIIVDYLDPNLDWSTVRFGEISYGERLTNMPNGVLDFYYRDFPPNNALGVVIGEAEGEFAVDITATLNAQNGRLEWHFRAIDTATGNAPLDAFAGILPANDDTHRGEGYVRYSVKPRAGTPIGTRIENKASVIFDTNDPSDTKPVFNTIGDVPSLAATIAYVPVQITAGMPFTCTIGLTNTGTNLVESVILTNALPSGVTVVNATATRGTVTVTNGTVIWNLGAVTNGVGGLLTITALPSQEGTFANTIYYSGGSGLAIYSAPSEITVIAATRPPLAIRFVGTNVELTWPTNSAGFRLQRTLVLGPALGWETLTNAPATVGQEFRLQLTPSAGPEFYRLIKP